MEDRLISMKDEAESVENLREKTKESINIKFYLLINPKLWHIFRDGSGIAVEIADFNLVAPTGHNSHLSSEICQ